MTAPFPQFDDGKEAGALRTIGEVASATGIRKHILRYWEQQFPMLRPIKRSGSRRYYRPADVELISKIDHLLNREGYTIKGALHALRAPVLEPTQGVIPVHEPALQTPSQALAIPADEVRARLQAIRARMVAALQG